MPSVSAQFSIPGLSLECGVIVVLILALCLVCRQRGRKNYAIAFLPLTAVPATYLVGGSLAGVFAQIMPLESYFTHIFFVLAGFLFGCMAYGIMGSMFFSGKSRKGYLCICGGFTLILTCILVADILSIVERLPVA